MTFETGIKIFSGLILILSIFFIIDIATSETVQVQVTVVEKEYEPERRWTTQTPIKVGNITTMQTQYHYDDEDWVLISEGYDLDNELFRTKREVDEEVYKRTKMSDIGYIDLSVGGITGFQYVK